MSFPERSVLCGAKPSSPNCPRDPLRKSNKLQKGGPICNMLDFFENPTSGKRRSDLQHAGVFEVQQAAGSRQASTRKLCMPVDTRRLALNILYMLGSVALNTIASVVHVEISANDNEGPRV